MRIFEVPAFSQGSFVVVVVRMIVVFCSKGLCRPSIDRRAAAAWCPSCPRDSARKACVCSLESLVLGV